MKKIIVFMITIGFILSVSGCGVRTYVVKKDRVDQKIDGNRGVIKGDVPQAPEVTTPAQRTIIAVDVEIPAMSSGGAKRPSAERDVTPDRELWGNRGNLSSGQRVSEEPYPYKAEGIKEASIVEEPVYPKKVKKETYFIEYTVKKGDTLSSIAAKSEIYGDSGKWKRIFNANKDTLKSSSRIYPGQVLRIPMGGEEKVRRGRIK